MLYTGAIVTGSAKDAVFERLIGWGADSVDIIGHVVRIGADEYGLTHRGAGVRQNRDRQPVVARPSSLGGRGQTASCAEPTGTLDRFSTILAPAHRRAPLLSEF